MNKKYDPKKRETESKGNIFNFFEDASKDPRLQDEIVSAIKTKGKGWTGDKLLKRFQELHYDGVSLRDCNRILIILESGIPTRPGGEWAY